MRNENLENQSGRITRNPSRGNTTINQGRVNEKISDNDDVNADPEQQLDAQENTNDDDGVDPSEGSDIDFSGTFAKNEENKSDDKGDGAGQ